MTHPYLEGPGPLALAHRGGAAEVAENSLSAIAHAWDLGYRHLETDVRVTRDGIVILHHDETVDRTTDGTGVVSQLTWEEVSRLRHPDGGAPVRLDEVLADFPGLCLNIDAKDDLVVIPMLRVIEAAGAFGRVAIASFSSARLRRVRRVVPDGPAYSMGMSEVIGLLMSSVAPAAIARLLARRIPTPMGEGERRAHCVQVPERFRGLPVVTPRFVERAHDLGLQVHVWTVNEASRMHALLDLGVDGIVTDRPTLLREVLVERGQWADRT